MSKEEVLECDKIFNGNKIIAEFMGITSSFNTFFDSVAKCHYEPSDLNYHSSWYWLMPVVKKICITELNPFILANDEKFSMRLRFNTFRVKEHNSDNLQIKVRLETDFKHLVFKHDSSSEIESTHSVVVQFIKWYNQNKLNESN